MNFNWKKTFTRLQAFSILLAIFLAPSNLFFKIHPNSGFVHGLQIDYLIPKLFATDLLMLSSIFLEVLINRNKITHKIFEACTQLKNNRQLLTTYDKQRKKKFTGVKLILDSRFLILFLPIALLFRLLFTPLPILAIWQICRLIMFVVFFFLVKDSKIVSRKLILNVFLFSIALQSLWGIGQFVFQYSLTPYWLTGETQLYNQPFLARADFSWLDKFIGTNFGTQMLPYGLTPHPNVLAGFLTLGTVLLVTRYKTQNRRKARNLKLEIRKKNTISTNHLSLTFTFYLLPFTVLTLFLTQSLSAWIALGLFFAFSLTFPHLPRYRLAFSPKGEKFFLKIKNSSAFLLATGYLLLTFLTTFLLSHLINLNFQIPGIDKQSLTRRVDLNETAWNMFKSHPIFGVGFNQFTVFVEDFSKSKEVISFAQPAHNVGILFLAEGGILGLLFLILLSQFIYKKLTTDNSQLTTDNLLLPFSFYLLPLLSLDHYLYTLNQGWWMIFIFVFLLISPQHKHITT